MATDARGHTVPASTDHPSRADLLNLSLSIGDAIPVANVTARAALIVTLAGIGITPSTSNPIRDWRADAAPGSQDEFTTDGTTWRTNRPRVGASVNLNDGWSTQNTRTHASTWSLGEDSGGFVGALTGNTTPIVIPAGKGGLYAVSLGLSNSTPMSVEGSFAQITIGGTLLAGSQVLYRVRMANSASSAQGSIALTLPLAVDCTLTILTSLTSASAYVVNATLSCYRIGD